MLNVSARVYIQAEKSQTLFREYKRAHTKLTIMYIVEQMKYSVKGEHELFNMRNCKNLDRSTQHKSTTEK